LGRGDTASRNAAAVQRLDEITRRLRRECPWDREQDERSIVPHTVEEAYELADAADRGDDARLLDELGDVLFQVHFLALLLEERGAGDLAAVAEGCREKLIRRHPHVFGERSGASAELIAGGRPETAREVRGNWDRIKREVEGGGAGREPFAGLPENLPALTYARKLQRRAASAAPDGKDGAGAEGRAVESSETSAARRTVDDLVSLVEQGTTGGPTEEPAARDSVERALGEALFALVDLARRTGVDPELALRAAANRFRDARS
jgi:nucleoside triphosphate diphosphatase